MALYFNGTEVKTVYRGATRLTRLYYQNVLVFAESASVTLSVKARKHSFREGSSPYIQYGWYIDWVYNFTLNDASAMTGTENVSIELVRRNGGKYTDYMNKAKAYSNGNLTGDYIFTDSSYDVPEDKQYDTQYPVSLKVTYAGTSKTIDLPAVKVSQINVSATDYAELYSVTASNI